MVQTKNHLDNDWSRVSDKYTELQFCSCGKKRRKYTVLMVLVHNEICDRKMTSMTDPRTRSDADMVYYFGTRCLPIFQKKWGEFILKK